MISTGNIRHPKPNDPFKCRSNAHELYLWKSDPVSMLPQCILPILERICIRQTPRPFKRRPTQQPRGLAPVFRIIRRNRRVLDTRRMS